MLSHLDLLDESHTKIRNALRSPEFSSSSGNLVASRHHGQLKNSTPATSSATTMGKRSPMSTTRMSQGGARLRSCRRKMRQEGLRRTSPSSPRCCASKRLELHYRAEGGEQFIVQGGY